MSVCVRAAASESPTVGANDPAIQATALLDVGRKLMATGAYAQACPKLEEAVRVFENLANTFNLGQCYELTHRLASAWYYFGRAEALAAAARNDEAINVCKDRRANLKSKLAYVAIFVQPEAPRLPDLRIRRGAIDVGRVLWDGEAVPVDQGPVRIEASAPGYITWTRTLRVEDGATTRVDVPALAKVPEHNPAFVKIHDEHVAKPHPKPKEPLRTLAWVAAGGVGAGLIAGFGGLGMRQGFVSRYNQDSACLGTSSTADPAACTQLISDASTWRTIGTVGFVAAGVFAATSAVLFVSSSPREEARTSLSCGPLIGLGATCALKF